MSLIRTTTVTVHRRSPTATDAHGEPQWGPWEDEDVPGCLVTPGASEDLSEDRPEGARIAATLHLPKAYRKPMRGCEVTYAGTRYRVVGGDAPSYMDENVPGALDRPVGLEAADG